MAKKEKLGIPVAQGNNFYAALNHYQEFNAPGAVVSGSGRRSEFDVNELILTGGKQIRSVARDKYDAWMFRLKVVGDPKSRIAICSLDTTYCEGDAHFNPKGKPPFQILDERGHDKYDATIIQVELIGDERQVKAERLAPFLHNVKPGNALLVNIRVSKEVKKGERTSIEPQSYVEYCNENQTLNTARFNAEAPYFTESAVKAIAATRCAVWGATTPSFSNPRDAASVNMLTLWYSLNPHAQLILAPLRGLDEVLRFTNQRVTKAELKLNPMKAEPENMTAEEIMKKASGLLCSPTLIY